MPKPKVDKELLIRVAQNARLNLSKKEIDVFLPQFKAVLESFSKIDSLDVENEEPSFQPLPVKNVFREDKAEKSLTQEEALSNTKHKKDGYFKGPKVVSE
ncbi:MAG TPA: Asp-tRNA(Asn)/Glu-tRNA(Gln) amidotransferase subunit GatC [archaeon]|nr:Asp-tRNA(Asn)/Glu-tRNA(Gln) amidotransferase subunit GatC [archaeon]